MVEKNNMNDNFNMIEARLDDALKNLNNKKTQMILASINTNCICVGTGGSQAVSLFASKVLESKNKIIAVNDEPRNLLSKDLSKYKHFLGITYGNSNHGIKMAQKYALGSGSETHLLTANSISKNDISYGGNLPREYSFISLASTIIPMSILLKYYLATDRDKIKEIVKQSLNDDILLDFKKQFPIIEIMSDSKTDVASKILESTIVEAGLGIPIIHEKYGYCHGRSTLSYKTNDSELIYLTNGKETELDLTLLKELKGYYNNIKVLKTDPEIEDQIVGQFNLAISALKLCKTLAQKQDKDLSRVDYSPVVKKLYKYKGDM